MTPGLDCDFSLAHPSVNNGAAVGFFLKPRQGTKTLAATRTRRGKPVPLEDGGNVFADFGPAARSWKLDVTFVSLGVDYRQAAATGGDISALRSFYEVRGETLTLVVANYESYGVWFLALEERSFPGTEERAATILLEEAV